ncbi:MAG: ThuA domain-containing protein [Planctomycetales bacterium]
MSHLLRVLSCVALSFAIGSVSYAEPKTKILFIGKQPDHPFATHMYLHTSNMLAKCLALNGEFETVVSDGWPKDSATLEGVRTIVLYMTPAAEFLLDGRHHQKFSELMDNGVGIVTLHWASSVNQQNLERLGPEWMSVMGGTWVSNVGLHTGNSPLKQLVPAHPICRGWKEYDLHDEYYLDPTIKTATPLLQVQAGEKSVIVGWAYERSNGGRSYATTLGHFYENFQREPFRKMVVNAILWSAKVDVPPEGAKVNLSEADLALPPMEPAKK